MKKKRGLVLALGILTFLLILLININFISAANSCDDSQVILRLSSAVNSHGAVWNSSASGYTTEICYNEIFGKNYSVSGNPHLCNERNFVLKLNDFKNAHATGYSPNSTIVQSCALLSNYSSDVRCVGADINSDGRVSAVDVQLAFQRESYSVNVCYGDLKCRVVSGGACSGNEELIVSLSGSINSHLASNNIYAFDLCCSSAFAGGVSCPPGTILNQTTGQCQPVSGCEEGETLCADGVCRAPELCEDFKCDYDGICEVGEGCQCSDCYGLQDSCIPGLVCDADLQSCQEYKAPEIEIVKPVKRDNINEWEKYSINDTINFEQVSSASRDLSIRWDFGAVGTSDVKTFYNCLTGNNCNTTYSYSQQAHYTITATATEQNVSGGVPQRAMDFTDILVYKEGINLFAIISNPEYGEVIPQGVPVYFNANQSFVANCTKNETQAQSSGFAYYNVSSGVNRLHCYDLPKPNTNQNVSYNFWFEWTFDPGKPYETQLLGKWNGNYSRVVEFNRTFLTEGEHFAALRVGYEAI